MKILIVGGTGLTGAHAALFLSEAGHDVTIMSRSPVSADSPLTGFAHVTGDYIKNDIDTEQLSDFDALVFCAGADIRIMPPDAAPETFYHEVNTVAIPRFFKKAKEAGIKRAVLVGSYYPHVVPEKIDSCPYVRSRHLSMQNTLALSEDDFNVCGIDAPFIIGYVPGVAIDHLFGLAMFGAGTLDGVPMVAPDGGMNFIASQSMSEAIAAALDHGESGKTYLVGDENLTWKQYLEMFCEAASNPTDLPVSRDEHPLLPDVILFAGRNATIHYEPDTTVLNYSRNNIRATVQQIVDAAFSAA